MASDEKSQEQEPFAGSHMSFGEHLDELRRRLIKSLVGLALAFGVCLFFGSDIFAFLVQPLMLALHAEGLEPQLTVLSLTESFLTYIKVSLYGAIFLGSPWIFYQLWGFIGAGLYAREKRYVNMIVPFAAVLFVVGGVFFITIVAPISCSFFVRWSTQFERREISDSFMGRMLAKFGAEAVPESDEGEQVGDAETGAGEQGEPGSTIEPQGEEGEPARKGLLKLSFSLAKYVSLILILGLAFSLAFQMPLVVFFLGRMSIVTIAGLCAWRKYVFLGIVVASAMMTPPDVISQILLALPMYVLYELGIVLLRIWPVRG